MPSPAIQIYKTRHYRSRSQASSPADDESIKDPPWQPHKISPNTTYVARKRAALSSSSNHLLTLSTLQDLDNRINETAYKKKLGGTGSSGGYSPYYRGLTDSSLDLNRLRVLDSSHGIMESDSTSGSTTMTRPRSKSAIRMNEWSFWFKPFVKERQTSFDSSSSRNRVAARTTTTKTTTTTLAKELGKDRKLASNKRKPLRERTPTPASASSSPSPSPTLQQPLPSSNQQPLVRQPISPSQSPMIVQPPQLPISATTEIMPDKCISSEKQPDSFDKTTNEGVLHTQYPGKTSIPSPQNMQASLGRAFLWADMYRPETLENFICNREKALELLQAKNTEEHQCGHFIFQGPPGVGKRTMITALLRDIFGEDKVKATETPLTFVLKGEAIGSIEVMAKVSSQHVEVNIDKVKGYEKHVIIDLIKENFNRLPNVSQKSRREDRRAIVLYEADQISADVLPYIRWLLEKYRGRNSLFFCCTKSSKLQSLTSLCTVVQLNAPSNENIVDVLKFIAEKEGIQLPLNLAVRIANNSKNNLRQAIRSFEATWNGSHQLKEDQETMTGWEDDIEDIARSIIEEQSPKQLYIIRRKLQNILEHNVSLEFFFMILMRELMKHLPDQLQTQMEKMHKDYIDRLEEMNRRQKDPVRRNAQHFLRIEAFIAKFMSWYKTTVMNRRTD